MENVDNIHLRITEVKKSFGQNNNKSLILDGITVDVHKGEFLSIFGPNGCGKTTFLNLIANILEPDSGTVLSNDDNDKRIGMVFQNYDKSLFPWKSCLDNIAFPLENGKQQSKKDRREIARMVIKEFGLRLPLDNFPYQMSGGQKQLASLARAMVSKPSLLLLDEPFASLDYQTRLDMQKILQNIWLKTGVTTILISHEIDEAIFLADRLILFTPKPARVSKIYKFESNRPRTLEFFSSQEFVDARSKILYDFHNLLCP